jgi:hypothetical protein
MDFDVCFISIPAQPDAMAPAPAKRLNQRGCQFRLPVPHRLMAENDTADQEHLNEIT